MRAKNAFTNIFTANYAFLLRNKLIFNFYYHREFNTKKLSDLWLEEQNEATLFDTVVKIIN